MDCWIAKKKKVLRNKCGTCYHAFERKSHFTNESQVLNFKTHLVWRLFVKCTFSNFLLFVYSKSSNKCYGVKWAQYHCIIYVCTILANTQWQQNQFHIHCMLIKHQVRTPKWYYFHFQFILFNIVCILSIAIYCFIWLFGYVTQCIYIYSNIYIYRWLMCHYNVWMNNLCAMHCMKIYGNVFILVWHKLSFIFETKTIVN